MSSSSSSIVVWIDILRQIVLWIPTKLIGTITTIAKYIQRKRGGRILKSGDSALNNFLPRIVSEKTAVWEAQGATWQYVEKKRGIASYYKLSNVPYDSHPHHRRKKLNIYFPKQFIQNADDKEYPIYIHVHGGGWSRGGKDHWLYGSPSIAESMVVMNSMIVITPNYRLGNYPQFMHDIAAVLRFVRTEMVQPGRLFHTHPTKTGGGGATKTRGVFLSGHSAGAHIAALILLRYHEFVLQPYHKDIPLDFIRGLVLVSGVYDLFTPMQKHPFCDIKNLWFYLAYVLPAFGNDPSIRKEASPLLLLSPDKDIQLWGSLTASLISTVRTLSISLPSASFRKNITATEEDSTVSLTETGNTVPAIPMKDDNSVNNSGNDLDDDSNKKEVEQSETTTIINTSHLPPILILNAARDMGLHENGELFRDALLLQQQHTKTAKTTASRVEYHRIPGTDHASICWNETAAQVIRNFVIGILHENHKDDENNDDSPASGNASGLS
jgi:acetyl esterase/lipase